MAAHRSRGDGGLSWDASRNRWVASVTVGYRPDGKRIVRRARGRTKTEAQRKLKDLIRDLDDGLVSGPNNYTVAEAVDDWLNLGLGHRDPSTRTKCQSLAANHIVPDLGARKLRELSADDIDTWLARKAETLSTSTLRQIRSILRRSVARAQARDKVKRNVVLLSEHVPTGRQGRPSKSLTLDQAAAMLNASIDTSMCAYVSLSILIGARTEELRALTWDHVDLEGDQEARPPRPPSIMVWRSVRAGADTKTKKSRRTLALPIRCVEALKFHRELQQRQRRAAGRTWREHGLVFASAVGTPRNANNVLRSFRSVAKRAGLAAEDWTPREMRHSFVSLLSDSGVAIEDIARLVGHAGGSDVTETVYRHQIRPVLLDGAAVMDRLFGPPDSP
jgi:integrase